LISKELAAAGFMDRETAYTAGMLHDVGRLALAVIRPQEYAALLSSHEGSGLSILPLETELFGCDHCHAGQRLVADWKLPHDFDPIVAEHHLPRRMDAAWCMAELVKISCRLADAAGFPAFAGCAIAPFEELVAELPGRERSGFHCALEPLVKDVTSKIEVLESL